MRKPNQGFSTMCVHSGEARDSQGGLHAPLYNHSTFAFPNTRALLDVAEGRVPGNLYTRYGSNPTVRALEAKLAALEEGESALAFGAGMAAETATLLAHAQQGEVLCLGEVYGGTFELLREFLPKLGIQTRFVHASQFGFRTDHVTRRTKILFFETPSNPNMEIIDIAPVARFAKKHGLLSVMDNTFASPVNQNPLSLGVDLVIHSATKYLGGHSDLTGGAVIGPRKLLEPIRLWRKFFGQVMAPDVAFLLLRSLKTLSVRVERQNQTALSIAKALKGHPRVRSVKYPGLPGHPGHKTAKEQMRGFGGMLSFEIKGDLRRTVRFVDSLRLFTIAPSLGGVESLVTQPVTTTHHGLTPAQRAERGITDSLVRLSCGLEDAKDLMADLKRALDVIS